MNGSNFDEERSQHRVKLERIVFLKSKKAFFWANKQKSENSACLF